MDNHKLVMISILGFLKHEKEAIFLFFVLMKNMLRKFVRFGRMHENKIYFCLLKWKINLRVLRFF